MRLALLAIVGIVVVGAILVALWATRDELATLPTDIEDDVDWLAEYKRWGRYE